jgi:hypothetical protein
MKAQFFGSAYESENPYIWDRKETKYINEILLGTKMLKMHISFSGKFLRVNIYIRKTPVI